MNLEWLIRWPVEPFSGPLEVVLGYLITIAVAGSAAALIRTKQPIRSRLRKDPKLYVGLVAGVIEELLFRGGALVIAWLSGIPEVPLLLIANGIWAGNHFDSYDHFVYTFILGLFLTKFWVGTGYVWVLALAAHSLHNAIVYYRVRP